MAPHSSTLAWKIPRMEEPGRLQSMGSLRVGHDWVWTFTFHFHALEKEMATHSSVLAWRIPGTGGAWWAALCGVAQSLTRLKRLSSSSNTQGCLNNWIEETGLHGCAAQERESCDETRSHLQHRKQNKRTSLMLFMIILAQKFYTMKIIPVV